MWWRQYDAYARPVFETSAILFACGVALSGALAFVFSLWRAREARRADTYGSARWANRRDIKAQHLLQGDGVVLGSWNRQLLRHDGDEHVLVVAPTSTGKSVGIALPTGLIWRDSYLTLDLKGENWRITSGLRRSFGPVFRFDPTSETSHRYNPLTQIRRGENEVRDAQALADMLVDPEGALRERSHWQLRAFELLVAAILWTLYVEDRKTLSGLGDLLSDPDRPVLVLFEDMLTRPIKDGAPHPVVAAGARQLLDMAEAERSGVVSTALGFLTIYRDPVLARATATSDFAIEDLVSGNAPVSLYLVIPPEDMSRLKALLRLILNQILKRLTEIAARMDGRGRRVLLLLDEFPQLGRLDFFEYALAYIRGYRIKACLIAQSLNQIAQAYGDRSSILENAHIRVAFACNDDRTAMRISDMLGATTETRAQMNYAGSRMAPWLNHTTVSRQEVPRPLLTPGEVMQLPTDEALILPGGAPPIRARKIRYFEEPLLLARVRTPFASPRPSPEGLATAWSTASTATRPSPSTSTSGSLVSGARLAGPSRQRPAAASSQYAFDFALHEGPTESACERAVIDDELGAALDAPLDRSAASIAGLAPGATDPGSTP